jgi:hypothetical protein
MLRLVLDTDHGRGNRHQGVRRGWWDSADEGWWDSADDLHHHGDEEPCGADERPVAALWRFLVHRRDDESVFVGTVVTAGAENSLPATRIDPFPEPAW